LGPEIDAPQKKASKEETVTLTNRRAVLSGGLMAFGVVCSAANAQDCEIKLGVAAPMSGAGTAWGLALKGGTEFEAAYHNANGGLQVGNRKCKIAVVPYDDPMTVAGGAASANFLASQGIKLIVGPVSSPENTGFKPVAKRNGMLHFTTTFALDGIGPDYPLSFQCQLPPQAWGAVALKVAKEKFNLKKVVLAAPNDQGGTDAGTALLKYYSEVGVPGEPEWYQRGTVNFGAIAVRIMSLNADVVEMGPMPPGEATGLVKALTEAGYKGTYGRMGTGAEQIVKGMGGVDKISNMFWFDAVPTEDPGIVRMNKEYDTLIKAPIPENSLVYNAQLAAEQITRAVTRAGTFDDVDKVAEAIRSVAPESRYLGKGGWRGKTMYGSNQQLAFPIGLGFIANGKQLPQQRIDISAE
jgi:branched-chain amino acid transport system substrate-binding protein